MIMTKKIQSVIAKAAHKGMKSLTPEELGVIRDLDVALHYTEHKSFYEYYGISEDDEGNDN